MTIICFIRQVFILRDQGDKILMISHFQTPAHPAEILLEAHALIKAHPSVWTPKMPYFFGSVYSSKAWVRPPGWT